MSPRYRRKKRSPSREPSDLHDIATFCTANRISESYYYALKRAGRGPREIKLGKRVLISPQAESDWRAAREAESRGARTGSGKPTAVETLIA